MSQWIPVSERLPDVGTMVLVSLPKAVREADCTPLGLCDIYGHVWESATHWMPLPDPPPRKLTHEEALRKAYESIIKFRMDDDSAKGLTSNYTALRPYTYFDDILTQLREALE